MKGYNEFLECPDDSCCAYCGQRLPDTILRDSWEWFGFCDAECCLLELLGKSGIGAGLEIGEARGDEDSMLTNRALSEVLLAYRKARMKGREDTARETFLAECRLNLDPESDSHRG